ncbi:MAG: hypothetical protein HY236_16380, partial [Acidobacteria bacterium]|nr:hypothetical protein [Acidobacteriota bacterium]
RLAAQRDFLTEDEVDQVRLAQEPNERLALYLKFARLRLELVKQNLAVEKPGRARLIHTNLEDYTKIIEAVDTVIDDALARKAELQKGVALVTEREKEFVDMLQQFSSRPANDSGYYEFVLKDALETTQESLDESQQDLEARTRRVLEQDTREKKKIESMTAASEADRKKGGQKGEGAEKKPRKPPTLRRKGEVPKSDREDRP